MIYIHVYNACQCMYTYMYTMHVNTCTQCMTNAINDMLDTCITVSINASMQFQTLKVICKGIPICQRLIYAINLYNCSPPT